MALASAILTTAGAVTSAAGSYYAAKGQKATAYANAEIDEINAKTQEEQARRTLMTAEQDQQQVMLRTAQTKSSQKVAMAANGVDLSSDTPQNILNSTDVVGEMDRKTAELNGIASAWGYRTQATSLRSDANTQRVTAKAISPTASAVTSLLGSAGSVANSWYSANKSGALDKYKTAAK